MQRLCLQKYCLIFRLPRYLMLADDNQFCNGENVIDGSNLYRTWRVNNQSGMIKSVAIDSIGQAELKPQSHRRRASAAACGTKSRDFTMPRTGSASRPGARCGTIVSAGIASSCRIPVCRLNTRYICRGGSRFGLNAGRGAQSTYLCRRSSSRKLYPHIRAECRAGDQTHDRLGKKPWLKA